MLPIAGSRPPLPPGAQAPQGPGPGGPPQAGPPQGMPPGGPPPPGAGGPPQGGPPPELLAKLMALKQAQAGGGPGGPGAGPKGLPMLKHDVQKVSPETSGYMGPDKGPFECGNCHHFQAPGTCEVISGPVEEDGCCNLFDPAGTEGPEDDDDSQPGNSPEPGEPV